MLTDRHIRAAAPRERPYKLTDGNGLHLAIQPGGSRLWRYRYELPGGKERVLALGAYPEVSLADARIARDEARRLLRQGADPSTERRKARLLSSQALGNTFEAVSRAWHQQQAAGWTATHAADVLTSLEADLFPCLGRIPLRDLTPPLLLAALRPVEARGANDRAHRLRQRAEAIFAYGIASGLCDANPAALVGPALAPVRHGRRPAVTNLAGARRLLQEAEAVPSHPVTRLANRLLAITALRPGEVRLAEWSEFAALHADEPVWIVPAERMKMKREHPVPLPRQAIEIIEALRPLTGRAPLLFPNMRGAHRPISDNTLARYLSRSGHKGAHVPHGWRSSFSTIMNELHHNTRDRAVIDLMLAHLPENAVEAAYNRAAYMPRRRELAQEWADMLLEGMAPAAALLDGPRR